MKRTFLEDAKVMKLYGNVKRLRDNGDHSKALEILDDMISVHGEDKNLWFLRHEQSEIFKDLVGEARDADMEVLYYLGSLGCVTEDVILSVLPHCTRLLLTLGKRLGSVLYFKECIRYGRQGLAAPSVEVSDSVATPRWVSELIKYDVVNKKELEGLIKEAELRIDELNTMCVGVYVPPEVCDSEKSLELGCEGRVGELRSYWMGLDVKVKRDFMKVDIEKLRSFVKGVYKSKGLDVLKHVLPIAREHKEWTVWVCRNKCDKVCFSAEECRTHLEQKHAADFKPCLEKDVVNRIGGKWAHKIEVGPWEPLDTVAAVEMINTQIEYVKEFTTKYRKKGWSNQWPLAADEKRSSLLKEIKLLLVSLCEHQLLSCSIRDWLMYFPVKHLEKHEVSEQSIFDCHIVETPQSLCFLECYELSQIRAFLKTIKFERHDGTKQVCRAVDSLLDSIRIKESIEFDEQFSLVLLDKRLLKRNIASFDDDHNGKIHFIEKPDVHYAKAHAQGDDIISWLGDCSSVDKSFPKPIREHNLEIWVAVLRAVQYTCRALRSKYAKKELVLEYKTALTFVENLCMLEDERRKIVRDNQKNSYASLLCKRSEERFPENSLTAKLFLCAVRDVLNGAWDLAFDFSDLEECMSLIREGKCLRDDIVLKSIELLKSMVTQEVLLIDAKILLIDNSRIRLLDKLTRLSAFDNRSYMLPLLKPFMLNEILNMESKAKSDAAKADLLLEEEKMSLAKKKKKTKSTKKTSTSMSTPVDKLVEQKPSKDLEPVGTSQSPKTMEEDSMEQQDTKVNTGDIQNMPGEDSLSGHLESALEGAPDMTLKNEIVIVKSKAGKKSLKERKKSQAKKTKKDKSIKITSTSMPSPVDKTVEQKPCANLEPGRGRLETSSNTDIQVEATTGEGAEARYNSSLDMTLKNEIVNMGLKAKPDADILLKEEKKSQAKKKKTSKNIKITSTSMASPVEQKPSVDLKPEVMEPEVTLATEKGPMEISSTNGIQDEATKVNSGDMQKMPGQDSVSGNLESVLGGATARYSSALDMTLKALVNINLLKEQVLQYSKQPCHDNLEEQSLFTAVVSEEIKTEGVYSLILRDLLVSLEEVNSMSSGAAEVLVTILESWHCWKNAERESLADRLFTLEENERMSCRKCRREPNYPKQSSYGIVMAADSIRNVKCAFGDIKFVDILKVARMNYKMLCDIKTGGCGTANCVHHVISRCPPIFTIVLEWEKSETEKEISETSNALEWEIDISRLYKGLEPNTNYRLVSMVGYSEEEREHICMAYEKNRWVNLRRESLSGEVFGKWKNVVRFCGERKFRPEILFYEAA